MSKMTQDILFLIICTLQDHNECLSSWKSINMVPTHNTLRDPNIFNTNVILNLIRYFKTIGNTKLQWNNFDICLLIRVLALSRHSLFLENVYFWMCELEILKQPPHFQYIEKMVKTMQAFLKDILILVLHKIKFTKVCYHT